jgi:hypothetical protein
MDEQERASLLNQLDQGRADLLRTLQGVTEEMAARSPTPQRWSILQCVEHLAISEEYLLTQTLAAWAVDAPMVNEKREGAIAERGPDRAYPIPAPAVALPSDRYSSLDTAVKSFLAARERTIQFVRGFSGDLRAQITTHPIFGTVNCYENLLIIAVHPIRHAKQIEECKREIGN